MCYEDLHDTPIRPTALRHIRRRMALFFARHALATTWRLVFAQFASSHPDAAVVVAFCSGVPMKHALRHFSIVALVYAAAFLGVLLTQAAQPALVLSPIGAQAQFSASLTRLIPDDSTFVSAAVSPAGCVFLSYIDRAHGNRLHVVRDAGDHVVEVDLPAIAEPARAAPSFVAPGDKQADGQLVIQGSTLHVYYTSRAPDDPSGPFALWRLTLPLPGCM